MPIYEFVCRECGHEFEKILAFSATTTPVCSNCGANNVDRRIGRPAIHFKGSGWYINDSKKDSAKKAKNGSGSGAGRDKSDSAHTAKDANGSAAKNNGAEPATGKGKKKATDKETAKPSASVD